VLVAVLVGVAVLVDVDVGRGGIGSRRDGSVRRYRCTRARRRVLLAVGAGVLVLVVVAMFVGVAVTVRVAVFVGGTGVFVTTRCVWSAWGRAADERMERQRSSARYRQKVTDLKAVVYARSRV